ncbi:MAG: cytochrome c biogenesis CcdA family protein [Candidatus Nanopelagicales bacterium]
MEFAALGASLTAGMLAAFSPCGFALLPRYLALFLGDEQAAQRAHPVRRSLAIAAAMTAGFVKVFGAFGLIVNIAEWRITAYTPYVTLLVGPALAVLGLWLLTGRQITITVPKMRGTVGASPVGMFVYGMIYATVSLSCTLPIYLIALTASLRSTNPLSAMATVIAYALGMGLIIALLTLAVALARDGIVARSRNFVRYVGLISGAMLVIAGAYPTWYGYAEVQLLRGADGASLPENAATSLVSDLSSAISRTSSVMLIVVSAVLIAVFSVVFVLVNRSRSVATTT